jgi:hypothetical protein
MSILLCVVFFAAAFFATHLSRSAGLGVVLAVGYIYGILRANLTGGVAHFTFDCAVVGYFSALVLGRWPKTRETRSQAEMRQWFIALLGWTIVVFLIPMQALLIQLVGLRGNCFLLPFVLIGSRLDREEATEFAHWLAGLNLIAFAFAIAEFILGVPTFFPVNEVTELIYRSNDVGGSLRIPATFANAHAYGGAMVATIPWLLGAWTQKANKFSSQLLFAAGVSVAMVGVFLSATRTNFLALVVVILVATFSGKMKGAFWGIWIIILVGLAYVISGEERLQRFTTIANPEYIVSRIEGSVNLSFFELMARYPLGNGLGAGGTSIPHFLQYLLSEKVGLESEYSRILLEQGIPGLLLWIAFVFWVCYRRPVEKEDPWHFGRLMLWGLNILMFATGLTGTGLLTGIPGTVLFLLGVGFAATPPAKRKIAAAPMRRKVFLSESAPAPARRAIIPTTVAPATVAPAGTG